jgi:hypothetical protein
MIQVDVATPGMFEAVLPLFDAFRNPPIPPDSWRRLFHYSWPCDDPMRGFVLKDGGRVVGFFGTILYERTIEGQVEKFANLTSWVTLPEYRNHSLRLFNAVMDIKDRTLTCHTAIPSIDPLYRRFGFKDLETKWIVLLPLPSLLRPAGWFRGRIVTNPEVIATELRGVTREYFVHLRTADCQQMLVTWRGAKCHVVFTHTKGRRAHFSRIHYVSNPEVFRACLDHIRWRMALKNRTALLAIDARLFGGTLPSYSRETQLAQVALYRSENLRPEQIDNLYSEVTLLGL